MISCARSKKNIDKLNRGKMEPISSIPRYPSLDDLYGIYQGREDESFFITQEEQAVIIQKMMDEAKGKKEPDKK